MTTIHFTLGVALAAFLAGCESNVEPAQSGGTGSGAGGSPGQSTAGAGGAKPTGTTTWMNTTTPSSGGTRSTTTPSSSGGALQSITSTLSNGGVAQSTNSTLSAGGTTTTGPANAGNSGTGRTCCLALAICNEGDQQIAGPESCPPGVQCYSNSICCSQVWCAPATVQCAAVPVCDPGDTEVTGACPPDLSCYTRTICGSTINCKRASTSCDPEAEYNRKYVADATGCQTIRFTCEANTTMFSNACGCGCEQDSTCPEFVDCMPGPGTRSPLCSNTSCPFTLRAM